MDLYKYLNETSALEYLRIIDFKSAMFKPLLKYIVDIQKYPGYSNGFINVAIQYTSMRKGYVSVDHLNAIIRFLHHRCAADAESAMNILREAHLKRK